MEQQQLVSCPLNPLHQVKRSRMDYHLIRCREQIGTDKIGTCPFNSAHIMLKCDLNKHLLVCPNRVDAERGALRLAEEKKQPEITRSASEQNFSWQLGEEEWGATEPGEVVPGRTIVLGRNKYSYKSGAVRRDIHKEEVAAFKSRMEPAAK